MDVVAEVKKALEYTKIRNYEAAEKIYLKILRLNKENPVILSFLGLLYLNVRMYKKSEKYLEKANKIKPNKATTEGLAHVKYYLNKPTEAGYYLSETIKHNKNFDIYDKYVQTLNELRRYDSAYENALECYQKYPLKSEALETLVTCCIYTGRLKDAAKYGEQLVIKYPKSGSAWNTFGLVNEVIFHNEELARKCYKKALACGDRYHAFFNLAVNSNKAGDYKRALYYAKKLVSSSYVSDNMNFMIASIFFYQRKFRHAFKYYARKERYVGPQNQISRLKRLWDGKTCRNETLLVYSDQGRGDILMFIRFLPMLVKKFKRIKVTLGVPELLELFERSFAQYDNVSFHLLKNRFPRYDKSVVLSNLPYYLKTDIDDIPSAGGYLIPDKEKIQSYKEKYFNTDKLKVGICWEAGAAALREQLNRTLNISMFEPVLNLKDVQFYSFQVKPCLDNYKNYKNLIDLGSTFKDFDDTAAALMNVDVMVTVDTSVAHLAGALGVKTFMLLPYCPDWRWFDDDKTTVWYDSMRIFKQKNTYDWDEVINNIKLALEKILCD